MNRRRFLAGCAASLLAGEWAVNAARAEAGAMTTLTVEPDQAGVPIARDFLGLSYESAQVAAPGFFSPDNHSLIALIRRLGGAGVLRIGGNTSEFTLWRPEGDTSPVRKHSVITPEALTRLAAFVRATGWKLIYGLNLGTGSPESAADEAAAVAQAVGDSLLAFQIGNEPDLFSRNALRPSNYTLQDYLTEWKRFAAAVRGRVPNAPLAGPDTASHTDWGAAMAQENPAGLTLLTQHYYADGPGSSPEVTTERLLRSFGKPDKMLQSLQAVSRQSRHPFRLAEANSCYSGGKYGVSDTLAAALWSTDFLFRLAAVGGAGVNFHGGASGAYTPIARARDGVSSDARPLYYALLLFAQAGRGHLIPTHLQSAPDSLTAYAARADDGALALTLINTDSKRDVALTVRPGAAAYKTGTVLRLTGPFLEATTAILLGGAAVGPDGAWAAKTHETVTVQDQRFSLTVPAASAATVTLR